MSVIERERVKAPVVTERDLLHRAADLLEEFGWCQGQWADCGHEIASENNRAFAGGCRGTSYCYLGAINQAARDLGAVGPTEFAADIYVCARKGIIEWNDSPERTKADVVGALRDEANRLS